MVVNNDCVESSFLLFLCRLIPCRSCPILTYPAPGYPPLEQSSSKRTPCSRRKMISFWRGTISFPSADIKTQLIDILIRVRSVCPLCWYLSFELVLVLWVGTCPLCRYLSLCSQERESKRESEKKREWVLRVMRKKDRGCGNYFDRLTHPPSLPLRRQSAATVSTLQPRAQRQSLTPLFVHSFWSRLSLFVQLIPQEKTTRLLLPWVPRSLPSPSPIVQSFSSGITDRIWCCNGNNRRPAVATRSPSEAPPRSSSSSLVTGKTTCTIQSVIPSKDWLWKERPYD